MPIIKARSSSIINSVDLRGAPTAATAAQGTATTQIASTAFVSTAVTDLINSAPAVLDTLSELAAAINNDDSFATTVANSIATKLTKSGDTMSGFLTLHANPSSSMHAATKDYVDQEINAQMIYSTDDVQEGVTNLYYHASAVRSDIGLSSDNTSVLDYNSTTGQFTYVHPTSDGILEGQTNKYYHTSQVRLDIGLNSDDNAILSYSNVSGQFTFTTPDTDKIVEGGINQYFTTARARGAISNGSNINYDSSTGIISTQAAVWSVNGQTHDVILTTDDVTQGSSNLYFTNALAQNAIGLTTDDTSILSYASGTFTFNKPDTDKVAEGSTNQYFTTARARSSVSVAGGGGGGGSTTYSFDSMADWTYANHGNTFPATQIDFGDTPGPFHDLLAAGSIPAGTQITVNGMGSGVVETTSAFTLTGGVWTASINVISGTPFGPILDISFTAAGGGSGSSSLLSYDDSTGVFTFTAPTTDDVSEGDNLYFTNARARSAISANDLGGDGSFSYDASTGTFDYTGPSASEARAHFSATTNTGAQYDSATGVFSLANVPNASLSNSDVTINGQTVALGGSTTLDTDDIAEGSTNAYFTQGRARSAISLTSNKTSVLDYDSTTGTFTFDLSNQTTDDVSEGATNLYYTTARTRGDVSAIDAGGDGSFSYDASTGEFTYTGPSASETRAHFSATSNTGVTYNSSTGVIALSAIPNASLTNSDVTINGATVALGGSTSFGTDSVAEESNLYYTQARFDSAFGAKDTDDLAEGSNLYYTQARFNSAFAAKDTSGLAEDPSATGTTGTQYFTTGRARNSLSGGTGVTYMVGTGVIAIGQAVGTTDNVTFNDVTVSGDLTVNGTLTAINSVDLTVTDKNIKIADGAADAAAANGAGITVDGANATITYASATDSWNFNKDVSVSGGLSLTGSLSAPTFIGDLTGDVTGTVSDISNHTTDALAEGSTNQYFTNSRAAGAISLTSDKTNVLSYNSATGAFTFALANVSTSDIAEGTNEYFTNARARGAISVSDVSGDGSLSYDSATGVISYTGPSASEVRAHLSATSASGVTYNSTTGVIALSSIPNSSLVNADVTINGTTVSLGGSASFDSDSVTEGSTNVYFTESRARNAVSLTTSDSSVLDYDATTGAFTFNLSGLDTSEVAEDPSATTSSGTMYFTNARARNAVSASDLGGDGSFSYDASTGTFEYTGPSASEARAHFSATSNTGVSYNSATGVFSLSAIPNSSLTNDSVTVNGQTVALGASTTLDTDAIGEGTANLYHTLARARNAISLTTSDSSVLSYDSSTGAFTFSLAGIDTDEVQELPNAVNQYFTTARARASVNNGSNIDYDSATGTISTQAAVWSVNGQNHAVVLNTDDINEGSTNLYFSNTLARGAVTLTTDNASILDYAQGTGQFTFVTPTTDAIVEGDTNQYHTTARVDARIAAASILDLADVDLDENSTLTDGFSLVYNAAAQKFIAQNVTVTVTTLNFTGDGTTTSFNTELLVNTINDVQVFINGLIQAPTYSFTINTVNDETSIVFDSAPEANDFIMIRLTPTAQLSAGGILNENSSIDGGTY
jgi:hypothetical protein